MQIPSDVATPKMVIAPSLVSFVLGPIPDQPLFAATDSSGPGSPFRFDIDRTGIGTIAIFADVEDLVEVALTRIDNTVPEARTAALLAIEFTGVGRMARRDARRCDATCTSGE